MATPESERIQTDTEVAVVGQLIASVLTTTFKGLSPPVQFQRGRGREKCQFIYITRDGARESAR